MKEFWRVTGGYLIIVLMCAIAATLLVLGGMIP